MAKKKKSEIQPVQEDEITLFDAALEIIKKMSPEKKKEVCSFLFLLVSCEEDGKLNMDKVRNLLSQASDGSVQFGESR